VISLDGGLEEVEESFLALASSNSNSATRLVNSATKAFINHLGEGLWAELGPDGIDVLTLCPGATDTEAPVKQGIDPATLDDLMSPEEVARRALDHITDGPVYVSSDHYRAMFDSLLQMPRRDALMAMADNIRRHT